ncbi:hypothetical protein ScPMuIL_007786 [Solemya velum]
MDYQQMFLDAVAGNDFESAELLLKSGHLISINASREGCTALLSAISQGNNRMCKLLLDHGACVDTEGQVQSEEIQNEEFRTFPLSWSLLTCQQDIATLLIQRGATLDVTDSIGKTPLVIATEKGYCGICKLLIEKHVNVNRVSRIDRSTALMTACRLGKTNIVQELVNGGALVDVVDDSDRSALHYAAMSGNLEIMKMLLMCKQRYTSSFSISSLYTPVHAACESGHLEMLGSLVSYGYRVDEGDEDGCTPLYYAAKNDHLHIVKYLLSGEIRKIYAAKYNRLHLPMVLTGEMSKIDGSDPTGETALCHAIENGSEEMVQLLLSAGCSVSCPSVPYRPPILRVKALHSQKIVRLLIEHGADVNVEDLVGWSPLLLAGSLFSDISVLECLLAAGADIEHCNAEGLNLLLVMLRNIRCSDNWPKQRQFLEYALNSGCPVSSTNRYGIPALHMCLITECLDFLLEHGADINQTVHRGCGNALANAADRGNIHIMKHLIRRGINIDTKNNKGFSPLYYAVYHDNAAAVKLLVKTGADITTNITIGDVSMNLLECALAFSRSSEICKLLYESGACFRPQTNPC